MAVLQNKQEQDLIERITSRTFRLKERLCIMWFLPLCREEDEESDGVASNQSAEDGSINENTNNCSNNGSTGMCLM